MRMSALGRSGSTDRRGRPGPRLAGGDTRSAFFSRGTDHVATRAARRAGLGRRFPSRRFGVNAAWLELSLAAIDLLAWTRVLLLDGELATAEPKKLRYRLLHVAARISRGGRRLRLRISMTWPWRHELAAAFRRLAALPRPAS